MKVKMTVDELQQMNPCKEAMDFVRKQESLHAAWECCEQASWMIWFLRRKNLLDKPTAVKFACDCASRVLGIYEKKYPDDKRPRAAIDAATRWLAEPTEESRAAAAHAAAHAAFAAYAAAYAAYAAAYAAYAAYAADDAAHAAAYAAYAAYAAAYAADAADADAKKTERQWQADELRKLVPNPFDSK
jgi:hypothetical protein